MAWWSTIPNVSDNDLFGTIIFTEQRFVNTPCFVPEPQSVSRSWIRHARLGGGPIHRSIRPR